jgi:hypothetical protein
VKKLDLGVSRPAFDPAVNIKSGLTLSGLYGSMEKSKRERAWKLTLSACIQGPNDVAQRVSIRT